MKTALYRHYNADGVLLYVGITDDLLSRTNTHSTSSPWFDDVAKTTVEWLNSRAHADALERVAVRFEDPLHNKQYRSHERHESGTPICINDILAKWPSRQAVLQDAQKSAPDLKMVAVHRWFARGAVPSRYWPALSVGAKGRKLDVSILDFATAQTSADHGDAA